MGPEVEEAMLGKLTYPIPRCSSNVVGAILELAASEMVQRRGFVAEGHGYVRSKETSRIVTHYRVQG